MDRPRNKPLLPSRKRGPVRRRNPAFTLLELLVVVGIVAILAAVVFPVLNTARERGRQTVCASNLRQIGAAVLMYTHDNDDVVMPQAEYPDTPIPNALPRFWPYELKPYLREINVLYCPSDPYIQEASRAKPENAPFMDTWFLTKDEHTLLMGQIRYSIEERISYGANDSVPAAGLLSHPPKIWYLGTFSHGWEGHFERFIDRHLEDIYRPDSAILVAESFGDCLLSLSNVDQCLDPSELTGYGELRGLAFRHGKRASVVFADGHVQALTHTTLDMWAADPREIDPEVRKKIEVDHCK